MVKRIILLMTIMLLSMVTAVSGTTLDYNLTDIANQDRRFTYNDSTGKVEFDFTTNQTAKYLTDLNFVTNNLQGETFVADDLTNYTLTYKFEETLNDNTSNYYGGFSLIDNASSSNYYGFVDINFNGNANGTDNIWYTNDLSGIFTTLSDNLERQTYTINYSVDEINNKLTIEVFSNGNLVDSTIYNLGIETKGDLNATSPDDFSMQVGANAPINTSMYLSTLTLTSSEIVIATDTTGGTTGLTNLSNVVEQLFEVLGVVISETVNLLASDLLILAVVGAFITLIVGLIVYILWYIKQTMQNAMNGGKMKK